MATAYIYVLHFDAKLSHAKHYIGCTESLRARLSAHANGAGSRLMAELTKQGMTWQLGGLYSTTHAEMRRQERSLKDLHNSERYCQLCHPRDQQRRPGMQLENIANVQFATTSEQLTSKHIAIHTVSELEECNAEDGMKFILSLMRKDKDALGFVPVGGSTGIKQLLHKGQIVLSYENLEPCGYAFYTTSIDRTKINIHQACTADDARLKGHGADVIAYIAAKHPGTTIIAKVRDDLAANHFWQAMKFQLADSKIHKTSGSTIHHYHRIEGEIA